MMRSCECGADISHRHPLATRCESCQEKYRSSRPRNHGRKPPKIRACQECGAEITGSHGARKRCEDCSTPEPKLCAAGCGAEVDRKGKRCESCAADHYRDYMATYMREHREQVKTYETVHSHLVKRARRRASELGREFSLTVAMIRKIYPQDGLCPVCRNEMTWNRGGNGGTVRSPSIDRIDNNVGYIWSNVHVVCLHCNSTKQHLTAEQLAAGKAGEPWQAWAVAYQAAQNSRPKRRIVRRKAA
jgi:hypothetical protein